MAFQLDSITQQMNLSNEVVLIGGVALGVLMVFISSASLFSRPNPAAARIAAVSNQSRQLDRFNRGLLKPADSDPSGLMKHFVPSDAKERSNLQQRLAQAGFSGPGAVRVFTLVRVGLGLVLPGLLLMVIFLSKSPSVLLPFGVSAKLATFNNMQVFQFLSLLVGGGYFGPNYWLNGRVAERKRQIEEGFPNALDLMQISVESGLGFDSAMTRVGNELAGVSPEIAFEFLSAQRQVQAGRSRDQALFDMAERTGVVAVRSFANVAHQSMKFGTSMSEALTTYAEELRETREMRAQEIANKLPVKMSAVLASLMLPALILVTVGPVVIRYIRYFAA